MTKSWKETWGMLDWTDAPDEELAQLVKDMVTLGADVNAKDNEGKSALDYIKDEKTKQEVIKLAAEYQRKQQEKDSSPMAQNDKITKLTKITSEIAAHGVAIQKLIAEMRRLTR